MIRRTKYSTKHTCINCGQDFSVKRNQANRNADIRYCGACKKSWSRNEYFGQKEGGAPKRISKFSASGTVSIMAD